jgi:hypothetical protein
MMVKVSLLKHICHVDISMTIHLLLAYIGEMADIP